MKTLENRIYGANALFVPVFSMRNRVTGIYELNHDGNFARIQSLVTSANLGTATVLIPKNAMFTCDLMHVNFIRTEAYGTNANATRHNIKEFVDMILSLNATYHYDVIIIEPNYATLALLDSPIADKLVYWCVASVTTEGTPWFVEEYTDIDKQIAAKIPTACANQAQVDALQGRAYLEPSFYNPKYFDYDTIFFPFRLTDENYHAEEFKNACLELQQISLLPKFKVFYTDVNNSCLFDNVPGFVRISSDHDTYLQVLKGQPIIPYLERDNVLEHISIHEFMYYHCELIGLTQRHKRNYDNIIYIDNVNELRDALMALLIKRRTINEHFQTRNKF